MNYNNKRHFFLQAKLKGCHERKKKSFREMLGSNLWIVSKTKRVLLAKVSNKIVETLSLIIGALRRIKQSAPPPYALHSNLGCLLQVAHTVSQHCLEGIVWGKLLLSLLKSEKCRRAI